MRLAYYLLHGWQVFVCCPCYTLSVYRLTIPTCGCHSSSLALGYALECLHSCSAKVRSSHPRGFNDFSLSMNASFTYLYTRHRPSSVWRRPSCLRIHSNICCTTCQLVFLYFLLFLLCLKISYRISRIRTQYL